MKSRELREIEEILNQLADKEDELTDWEAKFVNNNLDRFEKFGEKTFFSDKQAEAVYKMQEKYL